MRETAGVSLKSPRAGSYMRFFFSPLILPLPQTRACAVCSENRISDESNEPKLERVLGGEESECDFRKLEPSLGHSNLVVENKHAKSFTLLLNSHREEDKLI